MSSIKSLCEKCPFIMKCHDDALYFVTTLYSKKEAIKRLKKVAKPYGLSLHVGDFFSKQ